MFIFVVVRLLVVCGVCGVCVMMMAFLRVMMNLGNFSNDTGGVGLVEVVRACSLTTDRRRPDTVGRLKEFPLHLTPFWSLMFSCRRSPLDRRTLFQQSFRLCLLNSSWMSLMQVKDKG